MLTFCNKCYCCKTHYCFGSSLLQYIPKPSLLFSYFFSEVIILEMLCVRMKNSEQVMLCDKSSIIIHVLLCDFSESEEINDRSGKTVQMGKFPRHFTLLALCLSALNK
jgi:hypothetical protein